MDFLKKHWVFILTLVVAVIAGVWLVQRFGAAGIGLAGLFGLGAGAGVQARAQRKREIEDMRQREVKAVLDAEERDDILTEQERREVADEKIAAAEKVTAPGTVWDDAEKMPPP